MILIDGDILVYRAACAAEDRFYHDEAGNEYKTKKEVPEGVHVTYVRAALPQLVAIVAIENVLYQIRYDLGMGREFTIYLSGDCNFRHFICADYKANRRDIPKPEHYGFLREYLIRRYHAAVAHKMEADDLLGKSQTEDTVIASVDKDLLMIPGEHYNITKRDTRTVTENQAFRNFCIQMLEGDAVDNIKGLPGIGKVKARKLIDHGTRREYWARVLKAYRKHGSMEDLELAGALLWIKRKDYDTYVQYVEALHETN